MRNNRSLILRYELLDKLTINNLKVRVLLTLKELNDCLSSIFYLLSFLGILTALFNSLTANISHCLD